MLVLNHHSKDSLLQNLVDAISERSAKANDWFKGLYKKNSNALSNDEAIEKVSFIKRLTPFLLFSTFLMGLFPYLMITHQGPIQSDLLLACLFPFTVGSIFYFDNLLWNYFNGKRIGLIWVVEIAVAVFFVVSSALI